MSTLRLRLAALARWHADHGFADPTKTTIVRQVLKRIRASHPVAAKLARPLQIDVLQKMDAWFEAAIAQGSKRGDRTELARLLRNRAIVLLGFWRGLRTDELTK